MFTKLGERDINELNQNNSMSKVKHYAYDNSLEIIDIIKMIDNSDYTINNIQVELDDEYTQGSGNYTVDMFFELYDTFSYNIKKATVFLNELNGEIAIFDDKRILLVFRNLEEMPPLEITDFIQEKMKF